MDENTELLNFIYQNTQMGVETLDQLIPIVGEGDLGQCAEFRKHLHEQKKEYEDIRQQAEAMLLERGEDEKGLSALEKIRTYLMLNFQTMTDQSPQHIAEMLIIGSNMGVIDAIKKLRRYQGSADQKIVDLMDKVKKFEENNVERLKYFL